MSPLLLLSIGAVLGALSRHFVYEAVKNTASSFPYATFIVNIAGCAALGLFIAWTESREAGASARYFVQFGFLGAFTTFSAFGFDSLTLIRSHDYLGLALSVFGSIGLGIAALALMYSIGNNIFERV